MSNEHVTMGELEACLAGVGRLFGAPQAEAGPVDPYEAMDDVVLVARVWAAAAVGQASTLELALAERLGCALEALEDTATH